MDKDGLTDDRDRYEEAFILSEASVSQFAAVRRSIVPLDELTEHSSRFSKYLINHLAKLSQDLEKELIITANDEGKADLVQEGAENYFDDWIQNELSRPIKPLDVTLQPGNRVIGPPYDIYWDGQITKSGNLVLDSLIDNLDTALLTDGFTARGAGIFLDAPVALSAVVTPLGSYEFMWLQHLATNLNLRSRGGLGVLVYEVGNDTPLVMRQATLWSLVGATAFTSGKGSGRIADAVASTTDFGVIPLAPISFDMQAGRKYLFWVWTWQIARNSGNGSNGLSAAHQRVRVPFITTSAGPPVIVK